MTDLYTMKQAEILKHLTATTGKIKTVYGLERLGLLNYRQHTNCVTYELTELGKNERSRLLKKENLK